MEKISIVIRTYNEERYLRELLEKLWKQDVPQYEIEIIVVDSGSLDNTKDVAKQLKCRVVSISKDEFSFGRSLNIGCNAASGKYIAIISGHCIPVHGNWLQLLVDSVKNQEVVYSYGRQIGGSETRFSEHQLLLKYFPEREGMPVYDFFINNANACIRRDIWEKYRFNEDITGLEDMELAKRLMKDGHQIKYVPDASIYHYHHETWLAIKRRYERESIALRHILPEIHLSLGDFLRYSISAIMFDGAEAIQQKVFWKKIGEIVVFRMMQFWGSYRGNHEHRRLSKKRKEKYFFPR